MSHDWEAQRLLANISQLVSHIQGHSHLVVDVGCGQGRILRALAKSNICAVGIEVNPFLVEVNCADGFNCMTPAQWENSSDVCDVMVMSHVIEHFSPPDLLPFLEKHLSRLKVDGHLLIATPLMSDYFYDDFDHVKPYHPTGFLMVFGGTGAQVQYYARCRLELTDLWFRRSPLRPAFHAGLYLRRPARYFWGLVAALGVIVFRLSGGMIGQTDGWIGVFRKSG